MPVVNHDNGDAPPPVIGAVAAGVAPLPFLAVYATLFISRGTVHPVVPPDIGNSKGDELVAGLIALAAFVIGALAVYWFLDGRRRWLFALFQALVLAVSLDFVIDATRCPRAVPVVLIVTTVVALGLAFVPASWKHVRHDA